jgi:pimeloyl-ACP methyl ester carboxylesterase
MKTALKIISRVLLGLLVAALIVPFLIPVETSGTKTYQEAAGSATSFAKAQGIDIYTDITEFDCQTESDCENPPVFILLHGFGANTFSYRFVSEPLSAYGEVIAYDRPGFGFTERPTSWEGENPYGSAGNDLILDELIAEYASNREVFLVGHSAGGTQAAQYAVDNPGAVTGLILISPAILTTGGSPSGFNWIYSIPQLDHLGPLLVSSIASSGMDLLDRSWFDKSKITDEIKAGYRAPLEIIGWEEGFWEFNRAPRVFDVKERLSEIKIPTLLITGDTDVVVATADTEALATMIEGSSLVVIPNSGHLAQEENPAETMKAIDDYWMSLSR